MGKTALITGATSGLGYAFVQLLAKEGYDFVLVARNRDKLTEIKEMLADRQVMIISQDLSIPGAAKAVYAQVSEQGLTIDAVINNAGFGLVGAFDALERDEQLQMIQLNIAALTELTYLFLPSLLKTRGILLNIASTAAFQPGPFMAVYFASKAYVLSFTEALSEELRGKGVRVTALCPGPTQTNFGKVAHAEGTRLFARKMDAAKVVALGWQAAKQGKRRLVTGTLNRVGALAVRFLPTRIALRAVRIGTARADQN